MGGLRGYNCLGEEDGTKGRTERKARPRGRRPAEGTQSRGPNSEEADQEKETTGCGGRFGVA